MLKPINVSELFFMILPLTVSHITFLFWLPAVCAHVCTLGFKFPSMVQSVLDLVLHS